MTRSTRTTRTPHAWRPCGRTSCPAPVRGGTTLREGLAAARAGGSAGAALAAAAALILWSSCPAVDRRDDRVGGRDPGPLARGAVAAGERNRGPDLRPVGRRRARGSPARRNRPDDSRSRKPSITIALAVIASSSWRRVARSSAASPTIRCAARACVTCVPMAADTCSGSPMPTSRRSRCRPSSAWRSRRSSR